MDVVSTIISEEEILDMPDETLQLLANLFNTKMLADVNSYIKNPEARADVVEKLLSCQSTNLQGSIFSAKVTDRELQRHVQEGNLKTLPDAIYGNEIDTKELIEKLEWLCENESSLQAYTAPRTTDKFKIALAAMKEYQSNPEYNHQHDIPAIMQTFKATLFCPKQEKAGKTAVSSLATNRARWKMQLAAARYLDYCVSRKIDRKIAGEC